MSADRVELLVRDSEASPAALARLLDGWDGGALAGLAPPIRFTGLGSSRYAAMVAAMGLRSRGIAAWVDYPDDVRPADGALVAISASGATPEVVRAASRQHGSAGRVVALTNRPADAPLAASADVVLSLQAGDEASGIATRTYRATVATLGLLAGGFTGTGPSVGDLRRVVDALEAVIASRDQWLLEAADRLDGAPAIDVVSGAAELGIAEQAALMLREGPRLSAAAHETSEWSHTAIYTAFPGHRLIVLTGSPADAATVRIVNGRGGTAISVGARAIDGVAQHIPVASTADRYARAIVTSVVAELLAAELWRRTGAKERPAP